MVMKNEKRQILMNINEQIKKIFLFFKSYKIEKILKTEKIVSVDGVVVVLGGMVVEN